MIQFTGNEDVDKYLNSIIEASKSLMDHQADVSVSDWLPYLRTADKDLWETIDAATEEDHID